MASEQDSLQNTLREYPPQTKKLDDWMNRNFIWIRQYLNGIEGMRHNVAWEACAYHAGFICLWADRFDVADLKSVMVEIQKMCLDFGQAHDVYNNRKREARAAFEKAFSQEKDFKQLKQAFDLLAGPPEKMNVQSLGYMLSETPDATTAKLIDLMVNWKLICARNMQHLPFGMQKGWLGRGDSEDVNLYELCRGWITKVNGQKNGEKAIMEEYKALWNPTSESIGTKVIEARDYANSAHSALNAQYGTSLDACDLGTEQKPEFKAPTRDALGGVSPFALVGRVLVAGMTNGLSEQAGWFGEDKDSDYWKYD